MKQIWALLFALILSAVLPGCGGGGSTPAAINSAATGRATFTIRWPARSRLVPDASNSIKVTVNNGAIQVAQQLLPRPAGLTSTATFDALPVGDLTVTAAAFPHADGSGVAQATATIPLTIAANKTTNFSLTMNSTISRLELSPPSPSIGIGTSLPLIVTAKDASNSVVLVAGNRLTWTTSDSNVIKVSNLGRATAVAAGKATLSVKDQESGKSASVLATARNLTMYVTNRGANSVEKFDLISGAFLGHFISPGSGGLVDPHSLIFRPDGRCYVTMDAGVNAVKRYDSVTGSYIDTFVQSGSGGLDNPTQIQFGPDGNLYLSSATTSDVKRYSGVNGSFIDTFASGGGLNVPTYLEFHSDGKLYVSSSGTGSGIGAIKRYDAQSGAFIDNFVPDSSDLHGADSFTFGPDGNLYLCVYFASAVLKFDGKTGAALGSFVPSGSGGLNGPVGLTFAPDGSLYVTSQNSNQVKQYDGKTGAFLRNLDPGNAAGLILPDRMVIR